MTIVQVLSPTLPSLNPSANTVCEPPINGAVCGQQNSPQGNKCLVFRCPAQLNGMPLANTDLTCPALDGGEQCVASLSPSLATAGIPIFMVDSNMLL